MYQQLPITCHRFHHQCHFRPCDAHHSDLCGVAFAAGEEEKIWSDGCLCCWVTVSVMDNTNLSGYADSVQCRSCERSASWVSSGPSS